MISRRPIAAFTASLLLTLTASAQTRESPADEVPTRNTRVVSPAVAAALAAGMPKYNPPKPVEQDANGEPVDLREVDKPRNQIVRLPDYVVREKKPPVFREVDLYTQKGLGELAKMRYLSETGQALNRYTIPLFGMSAESYALMRYAEDERLRNVSELNDSARDVSLTDPENAKAIREATRDTYARGFEAGYRRKD
ncbi:MAG: hypothetical protein ACO3DQ_07765 [Cephaloticoccus sp.]